MKAHDLSGKRFGRLTAIKRQGTQGNKIKWECLCDCGNTTYVASGDIVSGHTKSCGCLNKETQVSANTTHGMHDTRIWNTWSGMKGRCSNPSDKRYSSYGGRGIAVCESWLKFENFYSDMEGGYQDNLTLDRIDNDSGYSKENCRWATTMQQCNNKRSNRIETVLGITDTLANLSRRFNIDERLAFKRLSDGWSAEDTFLKPPRKMVTRIETVNGITGTIASLSRHFGMKKCTVFYRINNGWSLEKALTTPANKAN